MPPWARSPAPFPVAGPASSAAFESDPNSANSAGSDSISLIDTEAELALDPPAAAVALIDQVRPAAKLPAYSGPITTDDVRAQLIYERQAELWLQAHSLSDWRRFNLAFQTQRRVKCFHIGQLEFDTKPNPTKPNPR